jgi:capsular exopolysaccharide synthesis family protein
MVSPLLKRYGLALKRHGWVGLAGLLGVLGISGIVALQPPPEEQYRSEGVLVQNAPVVSFTTTGVELQQQGQGIITKEFLLADILLAEVVKQLEQGGLKITPQAIRNNTSIKINTAGEGSEGALQSVNVSYTSQDPEESEAVLSVLFQGMVELSRVTNRARLQTIVAALNERLPAVETELREAEQRLEAYERLEGPAIQAALDGSLLSSISNSQNQRRQNLITLAGIDAQMRSLEGQLGLSPEAAYASSALSSDPILAQLRARIYEAETQQKILSQNLRPAHPTMVDLQNSLNAYEQLLRQRAAEVIGGSSDLRALPSGSLVRQYSNLDPARAELANQLVNLKAQRDALIQQQQVLGQSEVQLREAYTRLPNKQLERDRLAQQVALKRALYDQIQAKRIDAQAAEAETVSSLSVASPPATTPIPSEATNPIVVMLIGSLLGLTIGGGLVFLLDMLDSTIRLYEELDKLFEDQDIPLLGLLPEMATHQTQSVLILDPDHPCNDLYERLRSNLQIVGIQASDGKIPRIVLITSSRSQEGKTTTTFNLGIASARSGRRTLILEMDLRNSSQAWRLGVTPNERSLIEPLQHYGGRLSDPIQMVPHVSNLYIAPGVGPQRNPAAVLDSSEMERFLKDAKARFDFIVMDAPHFNGSNDAILLEAKTDGMIIVARPNYTQKSVLTSALEELEENEDIQILGAVINGAKIRVAEAQQQDLSPQIPAEQNRGAKPTRETAPPQKKVPVSRPIDF